MMHHQDRRRTRTFDVMDPVNLERASQSEQLALVLGVAIAAVVGRALVEEHSVSLEDFDESIDADFGGERMQFALQVRGEVGEHLELELLPFLEQIVRRLARRALCKARLDVGRGHVAHRKVLRGEHELLQIRHGLRADLGAGNVILFERREIAEAQQQLEVQHAERRHFELKRVRFAVVRIAVPRCVFGLFAFFLVLNLRALDRDELHRRPRQFAVKISNVSQQRHVDLFRGTVDRNRCLLRVGTVRQRRAQQNGL